MISNHFIACGYDDTEADIIFFGAPYDGTCSFRPGSRFAPNAVREVSDGIETFSPSQYEDLEDMKVSDVGDVEFAFGNREEILSKINKTALKYTEMDKKLLMIGGEHLVTLPVFEAVYKKHPDVFLIHFDAHADMRDDYLGEKLSHATVIRRISDIIGFDKIFQFGIRSGTKEEFLLMTEKNTLNRNFDEIRKIIGDSPVYLTIDMDVLDPSIFPGTGTPEPGGMTYSELLSKLLNLKGLNIVAADLVELAPHYDNSGVSTQTAAVLCREVMFLLK